MQAALIINPTSGISSVTERRMSPEETERTILEGLRACNIEPRIYHTTPEDTGGDEAFAAAWGRANSRIGNILHEIQLRFRCVYYTILYGMMRACTESIAHMLRSTMIDERTHPGCRR